MSNLVIYGGSFDPIHNGHLRIAHAASMHLNADVVFVPNKTPRWKTPEATPEQRLEMLRLALKEEGTNDFSIDTYELESDSDISYSIDTVRYFREKYPDANLYFLIGADEVNAFDHWKDAEEIANIAHIVYVSRPGFEFDQDNIASFHMMRLPYDRSGTVSSSSVRNLREIDIPLVVRDYIEDNNLYYMKKLATFLSPKRLKHSLSVAHLAYRIALKNMVEGYRKAYIAGLLHDIAKELDDKKAFEMMRESYPDYVNYPVWTFHQFLGAQLAKEEFGIEDEEILTAIRTHATGKPHMGHLSKIIYSSDKIEPGRGYDSSAMIDGCLKDYYLGFVKVLQENRAYLAGKGYEVDNPLTKGCFDLYLGGE